MSEPEHDDFVGRDSRPSGGPRLRMVLGAVQCRCSEKVHPVSVGGRNKQERKGAQSFSLPFTYRRLERRASACSLPRLPLQISAVRAPGDFASYGPVSALAFCVRAILLIACELSAIVQFDTLLYVYRARLKGFGQVWRNFSCSSLLLLP